MSEMEYVTGHMNKIDFPEGVVTGKQKIDWISENIIEPTDTMWVEYEDNGDVSYFDEWENENISILLVNGTFYKAELKYSDGYINEMRKIDNTYYFTCAYYNGGTYLENELAEGLEKLV